MVVLFYSIFSRTTKKKSLHTPSKPAIIVEFAGGIGNQLFQYMFAKYLERYTDRPLLFDTTAIHRDIKRNLLLQNFAIDTTAFIKSRHRLFSILGSRINTSLSRYEKIINLVLPYKKPVDATSFLLVDDDILSKQFFSHKKTPQEYATKIINNIKTNSQLPVYVRGYWQYSFFAQKTLATITKNLQCTKKLNPSVLALVKKLLETRTNHTSCSIHIRRGDYLKHTIQTMLPKISLEYYYRAIDTILEKFPHTHFYIFSDDSLWCKNNLHILGKNTIVSDNISKNTIEDLVLMNCCEHHILANSSFSWWGAMLKNIVPQISCTHSLTIAPSNWFTHIQQNDFIHMTTWIRL